MNKYNLGTILGVSLLGLAKGKFGSNLKLTSKRVSAIQYHFWAQAYLKDQSGYDISHDDEQGFSIYPPEYWKKMREIQREHVVPKLIKETLINKDGLITFISISINMEPEDDGDPNWLSTNIDFRFIIEEGRQWGEDPSFEMILSEMMDRYGDVKNIIAGQSVLGKVFEEFGIRYNFNNSGDGYSNFIGKNLFQMIFYIDELGVLHPYTVPSKSKTNLRIR